MSLWAGERQSRAEGSRRIRIVLAASKHHPLG